MLSRPERWGGGSLGGVSREGSQRWGLLSERRMQLDPAPHRRQGVEREKQLLN